MSRTFVSFSYSHGRGPSDWTWNHLHITEVSSRWACRSFSQVMMAARMNTGLRGCQPERRGWWQWRWRAWSHPEWLAPPPVHDLRLRRTSAWRESRTGRHAALAAALQWKELNLSAVIALETFSPGSVWRRMEVLAAAGPLPQWETSYLHCQGSKTHIQGLFYLRLFYDWTKQKIHIQ